ncbi:hypothetical protein KW429_05075 [Vibrio fluvialis]|uniref:hypothetical protein n=1 Tax=Vibrio fluvialis TaxID=676 RepID=UPI001559DFDC|nr:hypothetical protein [Vibrio fluvialis]MBY7853068.1 hypothetical protein [Vibrio fluvialis]MCE7654383.1 hypothetical protein [Vibrio fluvialis]
MLIKKVRKVRFRPLYLVGMEAAISLNMFNALAQKSSSSGSRSNTLKPLSWLLGILISGIVSILYFPNKIVPLWILICFMCFIAIAFILFCGAYVYFMVKDPDALRSEKFNIEKMAIQHGMLGDSNSGILEEREVPTTPRKAITSGDASAGQGGGS